MKAFSFRLASLLHLREQEEELWKLKLGEASRRVDELELAITWTQTEEAQTLVHVGKPTEMFIAQNYILRMQADRKKYQEQLIQAQKKRLEVLSSYTLSRQKAEVLRKLKERHLGVWKKTYMELQDAIQDDMVASGRQLALAAAFEQEG